MMKNRFAWMLRGALVLGALAVSTVGATGCGGDDDDASCAGGVLRDGKCYLKCDESLCTNGTTRCVAYTDTAGVVHSEGKCFATCESSAECGAGNVCGQQYALKGDIVSICLSRASVPLPPGNPGDPCENDDQCDTGALLACVEGVCKLPPAEQGQACGDNQTCVAPFVCFQGACQTQLAGPGEVCDASRACDVAQGLACSEGHCFFGCRTLTGCGEGYECQDLATPSNGYLGICRKSTAPAPTPGQFGTSCPKGTECQGGFVCIKNGNPANNYCSDPDACAADTDCPRGYWCGSRTKVSADGKSIDFDNPTKLCRQRGFCDPCENDLDCWLTDGSVCVPDKDGEKFCSIPCNPKKNSCAVGAACVDVGTGTAENPVYACRPDVGYCHPKGEPSGCDPCRIDEDCGKGALCADGAFGNKTSLKWCEVPCSAPDANGKRGCPVAPNGIEMICLDENLYSLGGPFSQEDTPLYGTCVRPYTVDNTSVGTTDPANHVCGDGKRESAEECDDGNTTKTDGCDACKITSECRFTLGPVVGPGKPAQLMQGTKVLTEVPGSCPSFRVEGTIVNAGDVAEFRFNLVDGAYSWFSVTTGGPEQCATDLVATVQTGTYDAASGTLDITNKDGNITACADLTTSIKNLDDPENPSLCPDNKTLACGSCSDKGLCGTCDDDSGTGDCPRMLLSTTTNYAGYTVRFASTKQQARIYAHDPKATKVPFVAIADRLANGSQGPKFTPTLLCY